MAYTDMERRILDMWPKFEDGAYVMYEDEFDFDGEVKTAYGFNFGVGGRVSICSDKGSHVRLPNSERVKRPAPKVLDADGVEIKVGDRVYSVENGNSYTVRSVNGSGTLELEGFEYKGWSPKCFTHMQPAIDADGVLIKVGDTVWHEDGSELRVIRFGDVQDGETMLDVEYVAGPTKWGEVRCPSVTHVQPDSWERLEKDATMSAWSYRDKYGLAVGVSNDEYIPTTVAFVLDLVRRAKALAEKEAGR